MHLMVIIRYSNGCSLWLGGSSDSADSRLRRRGSSVSKKLRERAPRISPWLWCGAPSFFLGIGIGLKIYKKKRWTVCDRLWFAILGHFRKQNWDDQSWGRFQQHQTAMHSVGQIEEPTDLAPVPCQDYWDEGKLTRWSPSNIHRFTKRYRKD